MTTPLVGLSEIAEGVASQAALHNTALRQFEARIIRVLSRATTGPPGSPAEGDAYIIPTGSPNTWSGTANQIAAFIGGAWNYYTPIEGLTVWVNNEDVRVTFNGTAWAITGGSDVFAIAGEPRVAAVAYSANVTLDCSLYDVFDFAALTGNVSITLSNMNDGQKVELSIPQDGVGSRTISFVNTMIYGADVTALNPSTAANKIDEIVLRYKSSVPGWRVLAVSRGYTA